MSYLEIVMWAAMVAVGAVLLLLGVSGLARCCGWHETESWARVSSMMIVCVLIGGTLMLIVVAGLASLHARL